MNNRYGLLNAENLPYAVSMDIRLRWRCICYAQFKKEICHKIPFVNAFCKDIMYDSIDVKLCVYIYIYTSEKLNAMIRYV